MESARLAPAATIEASSLARAGAPGVPTRTSVEEGVRANCRQTADRGQKSAFDTACAVNRHPVRCMSATPVPPRGRRHPRDEQQAGGGAERNQRPTQDWFGFPHAYAAAHGLYARCVSIGGEVPSAFGKGPSALRTTWTHEARSRIAAILTAFSSVAIVRSRRCQPYVQRERQNHRQHPYRHRA